MPHPPQHIDTQELFKDLDGEGAITVAAHITEMERGQRFTADERLDFEGTLRSASMTLGRDYPELLDKFSENTPDISAAVNRGVMATVSSTAAHGIENNQYRTRLMKEFHEFGEAPTSKSVIAAAVIHAGQEWKRKV